MDLSDKKVIKRLVDSCQKGDRRSQEELFKAFYGKMLTVCARYANDMDEAQDILQDGFIKVFSSLGSFNNKGSLEGWIRRIVVNNAIDYVRKKRDFLVKFSDDSKIEDVHSYDDYDVEGEKLTKLKAEKVIDLIQDLSPAYRTVFNMYIIENYTHKEIAEKLNISIGTSKSNLAKAKGKLKELFENKVNGID